MSAVFWTYQQSYCGDTIKKRKFQESDIEFPSLPLDGKTENVWGFSLPCLCCLSATSGALQNIHTWLHYWNMSFISFFFFCYLYAFSSTVIIPLNTINCSHVDLPRQHVNSFFCSFCLHVLKTIQQTLNLQALQEKKKEKTLTTAEWVVRGRWEV